MKKKTLIILNIFILLFLKYSFCNEISSEKEKKEIEKILSKLEISVGKYLYLKQGGINNIKYNLSEILDEISEEDQRVKITKIDLENLPEIGISLALNDNKTKVKIVVRSKEFLESTFSTTIIKFKYPINRIYKKIHDTITIYDSPSIHAKNNKINIYDSFFTINDIIYVPNNKFYKIKFNSSEKPAYITSSAFQEYKSIYKEQIEEEKNKEIENNKFKKNTKKFGLKVAEAIANKQIFIGMTKEQVIESWGEPKKIHRSVGSWGVHEQWIYNNDVFLYFENDKLTSWQD